jgi:putative ABC transport system substrate-binding protein
LPWALRTRIDETAIIDSTGIFWMEFLRRRREFITLLGSAAAAWPLAARAQQPDQMRRIGVLMGYAESDLEAQAWVTAFVQGFKELGWIVGRNVSIDYRFGAGDADRMRAHAEELVGLTPAVMLAESLPATAALQQATRTIPIVFVNVFAPVGPRFVSNLARPGGNITGFSSIEPEMGGKWLGLLKEVAPLLARVAVIFNPETGPFSPLFLHAVEKAAPSFAVKPIATPIHDAADIERTISAFAHDLNGGLIVLPSIFFAAHRQLIFEQAARHRLPAVYGFRYYAADGGLMSYSVDVPDLFRRSASYVDRILKGEKPGDLPVQAPVKYELVINLKTAKALGLEIPPALLARADEVIE